MKFRHALLILVAFAIASSAVRAQLPPDAVKLDKVKISEAQKSTDLCPVHLTASTEDGPTWTHKGVEYRGSTADSEAEFMKDPDGYAEKAHQARYVNNFVSSMSIIWCPVTDEVTPGGLTKWVVEGVTWESCCDFCDATVADEDFPFALERLKARAEKSYSLTGGIYTEGASSPVEGAIDLGGGIPGSEPETPAAKEVAAATEEPHDHSTHDHSAPASVPAKATIPEPAWLSGVELEATYHGGVGLIFENRCVECHRTGGMAPMSFTTSGKIAKWKKSMKNSIQSRSMPPWPADGGVGNFANSRLLSQKEMDVLLEWANGGFPAGQGEFKSAGDQRGDWNIGEPDHVFEIPAYTLGENETKVIKEFEIETGLAEDHSIVAAEGVPSDEYTVMAIQAGPLGSYYPGNSFDVAGAGSARELKAGQTVTVRVLNVKEAGYELPVAASKVGVRFAPEGASISAHLQLDPLANTEFTVPAGTEDFSAKASFTFEADGKIHALRPILNQRGKSVVAVVKTPDGSETTILSIPRWDPNWKLRYQLAEPVDAPKGTVVELTGHYDNSKLNAKNPNSEIDVAAGPGGEALEGWLEYSLD